MNNDLSNVSLKTHTVFALIGILIIGSVVMPALASEERPDAYLKWLEESYPTTGTGTVRVVDPFMNQDSEKSESLTVSVYTEENEGEEGLTITVTETGSDTGIFEGTVLFSETEETGGNTLQVIEGDFAEAEYIYSQIPGSNFREDLIGVGQQILITNSPPPSQEHVQTIKPNSVEEDDTNVKEKEKSNPVKDDDANTVKKEQRKSAAAIVDLLFTIDNPGLKEDRFGSSFATLDDLIIVGAERKQVNGVTYAGSVYAFDGTTGDLLFTIDNPDPKEGDMFGRNMITTDNHIVVGFNMEVEDHVGHKGKIFVFDNTGSLLYTIENPNGTVYDEWFASRLGSHGDKIISGSNFRDSSSDEFVYMIHIFDESGNLLHTLKNSESPTNTFGYSVSSFGDNIAVYVMDEDPNDDIHTNSIHVFDVSTGNLEFIIENPDQPKGDFGRHLDEVHNQLVVGNPTRMSDEQISGTIHIFDEKGNLSFSIGYPGENEGMSSADFGSYLSVVGDNSIALRSISDQHNEDEDNWVSLSDVIYFFDGKTGEELFIIDEPYLQDKNLRSFIEQLDPSGNLVIPGVHQINSDDHFQKTIYVFEEIVMHTAVLDDRLSKDDNNTLSSEISKNEITCKNNMVHAVKYDGSPACVKSETKIKLIERGGWEDKQIVDEKILQQKPLSVDNIKKILIEENTSTTTDISPVQLDRDVYPIPFGTPQDFAGISGNSSVPDGRSIFPIHQTGMNGEGIVGNTEELDAGEFISQGDLVIHVTISDPDLNLSSDKVDSIFENRDDLSVAGPLKISIVRDSSNDVVVLGYAGGSNNINSNTENGLIDVGDNNPENTRHLGPISETAPDSGIFAFDLPIRYTDGPANEKCPKTTMYSGLIDSNLDGDSDDQTDRFDEPNKNSYCIMQGDVLVIEYTNASGQRANTVTDSATFNLRNGVLNTDRDVYIIGSDMTLTLTEPDFNLDSKRIEEYDLDLIEWDSDAATATIGDADGQVSSFDPEPAVFRETGKDTEIFEVQVITPDELEDDSLERGEEIILEYTDWSPSSARYVGDEDEDVNLTLYTSNFGATVNLDKKLYTLGDTVYITVVSPNHNLDSDVPEEIGNTAPYTVKVSNRNFALENYILFETGNDTGIFTGEVTLIGSDVQTTQGKGPTDGLLEVNSDDEGITVSFEFSEDETVVGSALVQVKK